MIHIRVNRDPHNRFIDLHVKGEKSVSFPGYYYTRVNNLDALITTLQEVQRFMVTKPEIDTRTWEV